MSISTAAKSALAAAYRVHRTSNGNLPLYSDIRSGRTRRLLILSGINGDINALRTDLAVSLYPPDSDAAARLRTQVRPNRQDTLILSGLSQDTLPRLSAWLTQRGF